MTPPRSEKCECGVLKRFAKEEGVPVEFDSEMNEFHILSDSGAQIQIYYCFFCGGTVPKSLRDSKFHHVSNQEQQRIHALFRGIRKEKHVVKKFGPPDQEYEMGEMVGHPEIDGKPGWGESFRTLAYRNLSDVAEIRFIIDAKGRARGIWIQKGISKEKSQQEDGDERS